LEPSHSPRSLAARESSGGEDRITGREADSKPPPIRILIVDDQPLIRAGIRHAIESAKDIRLLGEAEDGRQALEIVGRLSGAVDVIVLDTVMPVMDGFGAAEQLAQRFPTVKILMLGDSLDREIVGRAGLMRVGGYVAKDRSGTQAVLDAIRVVARGGITFETGGADDARNTEESKGDQIEPILSERQREVLALVAMGYTNKQIAEHMYLSARTVRTQVADILKALGVPDRVSAAVAALRRGLID
jgi:two-component system, NarL family, response regulator LiaR